MVDFCYIEYAFTVRNNEIFIDCQESLFGQSAGKLITRASEIKTSVARLERAITPGARVFGLLSTHLTDI